MTKRVLVFGFIIFCFGITASYAEEVKVTTYYPSPTGIYAELVTTGGTNAAPKDTVLVRDAGNVGIGTASPGSKLDIAGGNLNIPTTASSAVGVITQNGVPLIHTYGTENFFVGVGAGNFTLTGGQNTAVGYQALDSDTSGAVNTASGFQALYRNTTGNFNVASGYQSLFSNTTGSNNVASGYEALMSNTIGNFSTAYGDLALNQNTVSQNTAFGSSALRANTTGQSNTAVGTNALLTNTTGQNNTATGYVALDSNITGSGNTAYGAGALYSTTGSENTALGSNALQNNANTTDNTGVGYGVGSTNLTGSKNTFIGAYAGTGSFSNLTNATAIGYRAEVDQSDSLILGGITGVNFGTSVKVGIGTTTPSERLHVVGNILATGTITPGSDSRFKTNIAPLPGGILDKLDQIQGVSYNRKQWEKSPDQFTEGSREIGLIGQDLERVFPELVIRSGEQEYRAVNYNGFTAVLLEAIKEQQKQMEKQQAEIEKMKKEITELKKKS